MVDIKTEPEATTTTTTATPTPTTTTATKEQSEQVNDNVASKIKFESNTEPTSVAANDNNNNGSGGAGDSNKDDDGDDDDADYDDDEDEESSNHRNGAVALYSRDEDEKTNLIVNYLPQQMTDEEFEELFKKFGKMKSCKIVRNRLTGYSYGFGFVDFETHNQALAAIEELNGQEVDTKKIKVAFARPAGQDIKQANLYAKNVPSSWSQDDVRKVFEPYGSIIQVRVLGNNRGVAFVLFDLRKQAQDALDALNGKQLDGCEEPLEIKFAAEKKGEKQRGSRGGANRNNSNRRGGNRDGNPGGRNNQNNGNFNRNNNNRNNRSNSNNRRGTSQNRGGSMYNNNNGYGNMNGGVGPMRQQQTNRASRYAPFVPAQQPMAPQPTPMTPYGYAQQPMIPYMMPGQQMMQMPMGQQSIPMSTAPVNPYSMGTQMSSINYVQPPMAQPSAAMTNMYNVASTTLNNAAQMQPQLGQPMNMRGSGGGGGGGGGQGDGITLFVYNIGPDCDENELKDMFTPYGAVIRCNVVRKTPGGETKGFGFVTLRNRDHANAAIAGLNNSMRNGRSLQVSFKK